MGRTDLVSIITPTFNCGQFISETIESVLRQSYGNWEMIIVDDCSADDTGSIVRHYQSLDPRIRYHRFDSNRGAAAARNWALREAKGRWVAFLDSDDLWHPEKLFRQIRFMEENDYHFSCTERIVIDEDSNPVGKYLTGPKHISRIGMLAYCWPGCLTVMYDRQYVGDIQIADIAKNNDYALWLKVSRKADCHLLADNLGCYRRRRGSISNQSVRKLVKWHYRLFREAENLSWFVSGLLTIVNLICGLYKKRVYVKKM